MKLGFYVSTVLITAASLSGCGKEIRLQVNASPPLSASISEELIRMPVGTAASVTVVVNGSSYAYEDDTDVRSSNSGVVGVAKGPEYETNTYVIYGVSVGSEKLSIRAGDELLEIPVEIEAQ